MKKLLNNTSDIVDETLDGYVKMNQHIINRVENTHIIERKRKKSDNKIKFVMGNGAGHEPAVIGWVGEGMFDINVVGEIFTAPSANQILEGLEHIDDGSPIILAVQNHEGDVMNANMAYIDAIEKGIDVHKVIFYDDIASAPKEMIEERRGVGGMLFYAKILGAYLEEDNNIERAINLFKKVRDNTRTLGVAYTKATHPATGMDIISVEGNKIEIGMGVHGEGSGENNIEMPTSKKLAKIVAKKLIEDKPFNNNDEILLFINGLGSSTFMEMSIFYNDIYNEIEKTGIKIYDGYCNNCLTTQELGGISISICKVDEIDKKYWDAPCSTGIWSKS